MRLNLGVGRRIVALLGSLRATRRSCGFWRGDGGAHGEAPGEFAITGSFGESSSGSGLKG